MGWRFGLLLAIGLSVAAVAHAQTTSRRRMEVRFTPTFRAQLAIWVERPDGAFVQTLRLTEAVAYRGIGNRPGAVQMNTGFRYPYGRREGVLPVWAHRRLDATGEPFPRVLFWNRRSLDGIHSGEGYASAFPDSQQVENNPEPYFCLSFQDANNALDAVSCASVFFSNKGRYVTQEDVDSGYAAQPWQDPDGTERWEPMTLGSPYPPRRDLHCATGCREHPDAHDYAADARRAMPDIDAVTMATLPADMPQVLAIDIPDDWPNGDYVLFVEANTEADFNATFNSTTYGPPDPDPGSGDDYWDYWSWYKGVPGRGQPSVVYAVPFTVGPTGGTWATAAPVGFGDLHGQTGAMTPMPDDAITDDPDAAPGSGADRLRMRPDGTRLAVEVKPIDVCSGVDPHPLCGMPCVDSNGCPADAVDCAPFGACIDYCNPVFAAPPALDSFEADTHPDEKHSHEWAVLRFTVPDSQRPITYYDIRYGLEPPPTDPIAEDAWFEGLLEAKAAQIDSERLQVVQVDPVTGRPIPLDAGTPVSVDVGQLNPELRYYFAARPVDSCNRLGPISTAEVVTTPIHFATVTPCFVATAAYGTPMADDIRILRRFRDRQLLSNPLGRALVRAYYDEGPTFARAIRGHDGVRAVVRTALAPLVALAQLLAD